MGRTHVYPILPEASTVTAIVGVELNAEGTVSLVSNRCKPSFPVLPQTRIHRLFPNLQTTFLFFYF